MSHVPFSNLTVPGELEKHDRNVNNNRNSPKWEKCHPCIFPSLLVCRANQLLQDEKDTGGYRKKCNAVLYFSQQYPIYNARATCSYRVIKEIKSNCN